MDKGKRSNLERLLLSAWDSQQRRIHHQEMHPTSMQPEPKKESRWKDYVLASLGFFVEYLALQYGQYWLKWGGAALLWLAVWDYTATIRLSGLRRYAVNVAAAVVLFFFAYLLGADKLHRANVSLSPINWVPGPPPIIQTICENDSDYPAHDQMCFSAEYGASIVNGKVPVDEQEKDFQDMNQRLLLNPNVDLKTLEPHKWRLGHQTLDVTPGMLYDFRHHEKTILVAGVIVWSDEAGGHRKEFCKWLAFLDSEQIQMNERIFPLCKGHNNLLY